jgi:hypothetical protein
MARYAMVHEQYHYVANVIEWDGNEETWQPPSGYIMVEDTEGTAGPGFTYDQETGEFTPPPGGEAGTAE